MMRALSENCEMRLEKDFKQKRKIYKVKYEMVFANVKEATQLFSEGHSPISISSNVEGFINKFIFSAKPIIENIVRMQSEPCNVDVV